MFNSKRWIGLVGLAVLVSVLVIGLVGSAVFAQGPNPPPGIGWRPGGMMNGRGSGGMMGGWGYTAGITNTVPYGNGGQQPGMMGGWGCDGWASGMMGRSNSWGQRRYRDWEMPGFYGQQPGNRGGYTPQSLPDDGRSPKTREAVSFKADIQPIFDRRCTVCHGGTAGLYLNSYDNVLRGGMNGPVVVPRDPSSSRLLQYVSNGNMPLGGPPLTQAQVQTLSNWIAAGAPDN